MHVNNRQVGVDDIADRLAAYLKRRELRSLPPSPGPMSQSVRTTLFRGRS